MRSPNARMQRLMRIRIGDFRDASFLPFTFAVR